MLKKFIKKITKRTGKTANKSAGSDTIPQNPNDNPERNNTSNGASPLPSQMDPSQISNQQKKHDLDALMKGSTRAQNYKQKKQSQPSLDPANSQQPNESEKGLSTSIPNPFRDTTQP